MRFITEVEKEFDIVFRDEDLVLEIIGKFAGVKNYIVNYLEMKIAF